MDLLTLKVTDKDLHHNFKNLISKNDPYPRKVIEKWANGFVDRDGKFSIELQTTFNSSFWELYIFAVLKFFDYKVDFSYSAPDFIIRDKNNNIIFCVEATTANHAQNTTPEWEAKIEDFKKIDREEIVKQASIRLANSLISKSRKYNNSYKNLEQTRGKPFILALAPFEQPFFWSQNDQAICQVLYGYKRPIYKDIPQENRREIYGHEYIDFIEKPNGYEVPMGYFTNTEMPEISAVIFSNTATFGKVRALSDDPNMMYFEHLRYNKNGLTPHHRVTPKNEYKESLLDGLHIYHNPNAKHPLGQEFFQNEDITHHWYSYEDGCPLDNAKDEALFHRTVMKLGFSE